MYVKLHTYCVHHVCTFKLFCRYCTLLQKIMADKSVNRSKYQNKKKYSGNKPRAKENAAARAAQIAKAEKELLKRKLGDNWSRYNEDAGPSIDSEYHDSTKDYSHLSTAPIHKAEYFQFKRERDIFHDTVKTNSDFDKLFNVDLNLISTGLAAIPFFTRCDLSTDLFTGDELDAHNQMANDYFAKYNECAAQNTKGVD